MLEDTLYLLGHYLSPDFNTTEELNIRTEQAWTKSFELQTFISEGCAVVISNEEIVTIAGVHETSRKMLKYNVKTGDAVQYNNPAPTQANLLLRNNYKLSIPAFSVIFYP